MGNPQPPEIGWLLKRRRLESRLTQEALAERAGLSIRGIQDLERGVAHPRRETVRRLVRGLALEGAERAEFESAGATLPGHGQGGKSDGLQRLKPTHGLPVALTSFVGREREVAEIRRSLQAPVRLLTLTGPPGVGKTRLALETAAAVATTFADGVRIVSLAPVRDPDLVMSALAQALEIEVGTVGPLLRHLQTYLRRKQMLLVLDNFEQVTEAAPTLVDLLVACPRLTAVVTSRTRLRVRGEREHAVPPLAVPEDAGRSTAAALLGYPSVTLFVERAQELAPAFELSDDNAPAVAALCRRLDGLPLAIELAASRSTVLSPEAMLARMEAGASGALPLLVGGPQDLPERQRTLRAAIDWSYDLLEPDERALFRALSVFAGGWTLEAAEEVCAPIPARGAAILDVLGSLVGASLVQRDGDSRFSMLESLREYALERLEEEGEAEAARRRHADHYLALAERAEPGLRSSTGPVWIDLLTRELSNLRAVWAWDQTRQDGGGVRVRLAGALWLYWYRSGHMLEGYHWCAEALALTATAGRTKERARVLSGAGELACAVDTLTSARSFAEESVAIWRELGDRRGLAGGLRTLWMVAANQNDHATARVALSECVAICRALGDTWGLADTLVRMALVKALDWDCAAARAAYLEGLALFRDLGDRLGQSVALNSLARVACLEGDDAAARAFSKECVALRRELGDRYMLAVAVHQLGDIRRRQGDYAEATALYAESLRLYHEVGSNNVGWDLLAFAGLAAELGHWERAARLFGAATALHAALGVARDPQDSPEDERWMAATRAALGDAAFAAACDAGRAMPVDEAVDEALVGGS